MLNNVEKIIKCNASCEQVREGSLLLAPYGLRLAQRNQATSVNLSGQFNFLQDVTTFVRIPLKILRNLLCTTQEIHCLQKNPRNRSYVRN